MNLIKSIVTTSLVSLFSATVAFAGGPLDLNFNDPDNVSRYANGGLNIPFNPDQGGLGTLSNAEIVAITEQAFQVWQDIPTATATYSNNGTLAFDIDETNFMPFVNLLFGIPSVADGISPIAYDEDGAIFDALFGVGTGVLGFASADTFDANGAPIEGVAFFNGGFALAPDDLLGVFVHEFGHYSGMAHTVVNGQNIILGDQSGPTPNNTFGNSPVSETETMYPFIITGGGESTVHRDDIGFFSFLYPSVDFFNVSATVSGTVFAPNGATPLTGVNVIARNVDDPFADAVSAITGDRGVTGTYTLNGLTPGANYAIYVDQILQGGFSTPPIGLPGSEEFYNGANESSNGLTDNPADFVTVATAAGTTSANIDIIFNGPTPGVPLNLGIDGSQQVFLPFDFNMCGRVFDSVFINANGNVTFGAPSTDFTESAAELLSGPPRIAALWDDLNPSAGGSVVFEQPEGKFIIRWQDVPEFFATGANSFEIILRENHGSGGNRFEVAYSGGTATDGIAGFSCGGGITSELETAIDFSSRPGLMTPTGATAFYEVFNAANPNDLINGHGFAFTKTFSFSDVYEDNDSLADATKIDLPFSSKNSQRYTEISPSGDDVDFFLIFARAGTTLLAETRTGQLDTLMGLFDVNGNQLAVDDDGGTGLLSRIIFPITTTGFYYLAVTTWPDFDFTGDGTPGNRYVLEARTVHGTPISLGDDTSLEVPLAFSFPYQGQNYSSVFVNSNGNLSFGIGSGDFSESVFDLLNGPPRISPLWDDLNPGAGGLVLVNSEGSEFSVSFENVPQFGGTDVNNFTVTLLSDGTVVMDYGQVDTVDALVGISEGGGALDPGETDLSINPNNSVSGTVYELFDFVEGFDLDGSILVFE